MQSIPICGIVTPVFNAAAGLPELIDRLAAVARSITRWRLIMVIVDDGSLPAFPSPGHPHLSIETLRHQKNLGKGAALKTGFAHCLSLSRCHAVVTLDGDLQHPPEVIPRFLSAFEEKRGELIVGRRSWRPGVMPLHRILSNSLTTAVIRLMIGRPAYDSQCGFRLYSRHALTTVHPEENGFHFESEFLIRCGWARLPIAAVPVPTIYNGAPSAIRHLPDTVSFISLILRMIRLRIAGNV